MSDDETKDQIPDTLNDPPPGGFRSKAEARAEIARQMAEDAANLAEAARAYQEGGEAALRELIERKSREPRPVRRPLVARRD